VCLISLVFLLGLVSNTSAVNVKWDGGGGANTLWSNAANWDVGVPGTADTVRLDGAYTALIDSTVTANASLLYGPGVDVAGLFTLNMTGGTLNVGSSMQMTYAAVSSGLWNMSGGTANIATELWVGHDGVATITMTGGTINVNSGIYIPKISTGDGHVNLDGGVINAASFYMRSSGGVGTMDITNGTLIVNGDARTAINGYITSGWLTAFGGTGTVNVDYNVTNPGKTTVTASIGSKAASPSPADGAVGVSLSTILSWTAGIGAVSHDVYFGTDSTPDETEFKGNQTATTFNPGTLNFGITYYWRIDEKDASGGTTTGNVWSFTTRTGSVILRKGPYLMYQGNNTQMTVLWQLDGSVTCTLAWGLDTTYSTGSTQTTEYGGDRQHAYTITGLTPGIKYYYKLTVEAGVTTGSFQTAPAASATSVKLFAYGDTRTNPGDHSTVCAGMNSVIVGDPAYQTMLLHVGDWVESNAELNWTNEYFNRSYPAALQTQASLPIQGCMGNHESTGTVYTKYWPYPYVAVYVFSKSETKSSLN